MPSDRYPAPSGPGAPVTSDALASTITISETTFVADPAGALYWPEQKLLCVADLHLEKGSSLARRGSLLPPYDTAATLRALSGLLARYAPRLVITLGDSFHDSDGPARMAPSDLATVADLQRGRDWLWITGNHDPEPATNVGGGFARAVAIGALVFRHEPSGQPGEIAGHLHPSARVRWRGHAITRRCFAADAERAVLPAFGAYTGGLSVRDPAFDKVFAGGPFTAHLLGGRRVYAFASARCS
jgi:DNA ligase-associated metallophosphoesterase